MAIALVQYDEYESGIATVTIANDTPLNTTTGNFLVAIVCSNDSGSDGVVTGVADTAENTYTKVVGEYYTGTNSQRAEIWYTENIIGNASNVTTATFTGTTSGAYISVAEFSGVKQSFSLAGYNYNPNPGVTDHYSGYILSTEVGDLIVGAYKSDVNENITLGSGFSALSSDLTTVSVFAEYRILPSYDSYTADCTTGTTSSSIMVAAIFVPEESAPPFAKETFEGGAIPATMDDVETASGSCTTSLDGTSKVNGTYSVKFVTTGEASAYAAKYMGTDRTEIYAQFSIFLPTGFTLGAENYAGLFNIQDSAGNNRIVCNLEFDDPVYLLTFSGDVEYIYTEVYLSLNQIHKIQVYIKKDTTTGRIKVWLDNNVEGNPDYDSGNVNTSADNFRRIMFGPVYVPEAIGTFYIDDLVFDTSFIGGETIAEKNSILRLYCNPNGGGGGCFLTGTLIKTLTKNIPIEKLLKGDKIYAFSNYGNKKIVKIIHIIKRTAQGYFIIKTTSKKVRVTGEHPFFAVDGMKRVKEIKVGDKLKSFEGEEIVKEKKFINKKVVVFNLQVSPPYSYYANNFAVHNKV